MKNFDKNFWQFIDNQLQNDSFFVANLELSTLLLMNDKNYPWLILVPRVNFVYDLIDLDFNDQITLLNEINLCAKFLKEKFLVDKLNIASLGNIVKQLHVHIIARNKNDLSFPKPVWGSLPANKYEEIEAKNFIYEIQNFLLNFKK